MSDSELQSAWQRGVNSRGPAVSSNWFLDHRNKSFIVWEEGASFQDVKTGSGPKRAIMEGNVDPLV